MSQANPVVEAIQKLLGLVRAAVTPPTKPPQSPASPVSPPRPQRSATDYFTEGNALQNRGDNDGAIARYNEAIRLNPTFGKALWQRHEAFYNKHDFRQATLALNEWLRVFPRDPNLDIAYGIRAMYHAYDKDWAGAIADFTESLRYNSQDAYTYFSRGVARARNGDQAGADQDFAMARRLGYMDTELPAWAE